jgi:hypothetical protein
MSPAEAVKEAFRRSKKESSVTMSPAKAVKETFRRSKKEISVTIYRSRQVELTRRSNFSIERNSSRSLSKKNTHSYRLIALVIFT